jgi:hypothetical protein
LNAALPADVNTRGDQGLDGSPDAGPSAQTVTDGVAVAVLLAELALNAFGSPTQAMAVRSLERTYRRHKAREMELALAHSLAATHAMPPLAYGRARLWPVGYEERDGNRKGGHFGHPT